MPLEKNHFYRFGSFRLDPAKRIVVRGQKSVRLMPKAFDTLLVLVQNRDRMVGKEELMKALWPDRFVEEANLAQNVAVLRKALGDSPEEHRYIVTIPGRGYRFAAEVSEETEEDNTHLVVERHSRSRAKTEESRLPDARPQASPAARTVAHWVMPAASVAVLSAVIGSVFSPARTPHVTSTTRLTQSGRIDDWGNLVTDGPRIYFLERDGAHWNLMQTSTRGGVSQRLGTALPGSNTQIMDISRDLSQFLVSTFVMHGTEMPLWTLPVQGGAPHRVGDIETKYAVWIQDGRQILYAHDKDLLITDVDGKNTRKLVTALGRISDISVAPNGHMIRFSLENPHTTNQELWEVSADGSDLHRLFSSWTQLAGECCGRWTRDGRYYVFLAWQGDRAGVWAVREKNRGPYFWKQPSPFNLISGPTLFTNMIPDRDGRKLFAVGRNIEDDMMRYDQKLRALVSVPGLPRNSTVFYSPTGEWLLYQNNSDFSLWRSRVDGSQPLQLTPPLLRLADPQWSPDSTQIVFMGAGEGPNQGTQIYVVSRNGGKPRRVLQQNGSQFHPHWLPDGQSLAISVSPVEGEKVPIPGIYVTNVATQQAYKLPQSTDIDSGEWSPDGRFVLGVTNDFHRIKLYDVWTNKWAEVVTATQISGASWAPDSQSIYYQDAREEQQPIYRVRLFDMRRENVYDFHRELSSGYFRCLLYGIKSDGSLVIRLSRSDADLYAFDVDLP
jgi:DNA-binding winged helix-turn-helix (wHTH) protein/Tol biopolymer transport system component